MNWKDLLSIAVVLLPILIWMWFWTKHDLECKRNYAIYDKTGKEISNFGDWLDGKER